MEKEIFEKIKRVYSQADSVGREIMEREFPELAESEDDRIRKKLINIVGLYYGTSTVDPERDECIAYLENLKPSFRQIHDGIMWDSGLRTGIELGKKEQKSLNISAASEWLREHVCNYVNSEYNEFHKCVEYDGSIDKEKLINDFEEAMQKESLRDFIDDFPYSCEQEEQKPVDGITQDEIEQAMKTLTDFKVFATKEAKQYNISHRRDIDWHNFCASLLTYLEVNKPVECIPDSVKFDEGFKTGREIGFREGVESVKPAEWSEEDEDMRLEAIRVLVSGCERYRKESGCLPSWHKVIDWLKALSLNRKKENEDVAKLCSNEWSEEDEKLFWGFTAWVPNEELERLGVTRDDILKKLKSLRPQPKQEWSKEDENKIERLAFLISVVAEKEMISPEECIDLRRFVKSYHPQSKQEWSEEDKDYYDTIVRKLEVIGDDSGLSDNQIKFLREHCPLNCSEWSEEDEEMRQSIIKDIEFERNYTYATTGKSSEKYNEQINWLKVLSLNRKKINEGVEKLCSNEWSEEDERIMNGIQLVLESWDRTHSSLSGLPSLIPSYISWLKSRRSQPKQKRQIKEGDKVSIHCRKDRKEGIITIYDGKVGEVIHVWDAKRNPWGHIGVRLDNGCNRGFYEDELEVLDELSWKPSEVCYGAKGDPDPAGVWKPSEEQIHAIIEALKYLPNNKDEWRVLNTLVDVFRKLM